MSNSPSWTLNTSGMGSRYSDFNLHGDNRNCSCYRAVKRLEHGMKVVERVL